MIFLPTGLDDLELAESSPSVSSNDRLPVLRFTAMSHGCQSGRCQCQLCLWQRLTASRVSFPLHHGP